MRAVAASGVPTSPPEGVTIRREAGARARQVAGEPGHQPERTATFAQVFAIGEFRALWIAQVLSIVGDQLARVALTLLVYDRTRSALLAAVTFAASVVPAFVGGITLAGLADRLPRRAVMIGCDLVSAALVAVMAVPGLPVAALVVLLFVVTMVGAPFSSARAALYPDILRGEHYVLGTAITITTIQFSQVVGFAVGGIVVGLLGVHASLVVDAATFALSALITRLWVRSRPAPVSRGFRLQAVTPDAAAPGESARPAQTASSGNGARPDHAAMTRAGRDGTPERTGPLTGLRVVFMNRALRTPMLLGWLATFYNVPEGVAVPLAAALGGGAVAVGLILAAPALGASAGSILLSRFVAPARRLRWMGPLAVAATGVLVAFVFQPGLPAALVILAASGVFACYQLAANASFVSAVPAKYRSSAFGVAQAGMSLGQGAAIVVAGAAAQGGHSAARVIAVAGALGALCGLALAVRRAGGRRPTARA